MGPDFTDQAVMDSFEAFPGPHRQALLLLRNWIFEISKTRQDVGSVVEDLKWGQPSYSTRPKTGCPLRLGMPKSMTSCALYVPCQTSLVAELRDHYEGMQPDNLVFEGNRGLHFMPSKPLPEAFLRHAITLGLTYYSRKKKTGA